VHIKRINSCLCLRKRCRRLPQRPCEMTRGELKNSISCDFQDHLRKSSNPICDGSLRHYRQKFSRMHFPIHTFATRHSADMVSSHRSLQACFSPYVGNESSAVYDNARLYETAWATLSVPCVRKMEFVNSDRHSCGSSAQYFAKGDNFAQNAFHSEHTGWQKCRFFCNSRKYVVLQWKLSFQWPHFRLLKYLMLG